MGWGPDRELPCSRRIAFDVQHRRGLALVLPQHPQYLPEVLTGLDRFAADDHWLDMAVNENA